MAVLHQIPKFSTVVNIENSSTNISVFASMRNMNNEIGKQVFIPVTTKLKFGTQTLFQKKLDMCCSLR